MDCAQSAHHAVARSANSFLCVSVPLWFKTSITAVDGGRAGF